MPVTWRSPWKRPYAVAITSSERAISDAIGLTIAVIGWARDPGTLRIALHGSSGSHVGTLAITDLGQDCSEHRYMMCDDDLAGFIGAKLVAVEVRDAPDQDCGGDEVHEVKFLVVRTDNGAFTVATHNEHNGLYGGFQLNASMEWRDA